MFKQAVVLALLFVLLVFIFTPSHVQGDVTGDGEVNIRDLLRLQRYMLRLDSVPYAELWRYDVNGDGVVDHQDVEYLQKILLGIK